MTRIDADAATPIYWDARLTFDPTDATVELEVDDGTRHPMQWEGPAVQVGDEWERTARTSDLFAGTDATPGSGVVSLPAGRHLGKPLVHTTGGRTIPCYPPVPIDVY